METQRSEDWRPRESLQVAFDSCVGAGETCDKDVWLKRVHSFRDLSVPMALLSINRKRALGFRQRATHLHTRLRSHRLVDAAFAGLQDSVPRSAVLALHARVEDVWPSAWKDPRFVQVWGPRGAVYVVPKDDVAVFTLGRLPRDPALGAAIHRAADKVRKAFLNRQTRGAHVPYEQTRRLSLHDLRSAAITGTVRIDWDASSTTWWVVDPPVVEAEPARLELACRFLRSLGPATAKEFAWWSGVLLSDARQTFRSLERELTEVELDGRKSWVLRTDRAALEHAAASNTVRLLPPGDPYLAAGDRELLAPESRFRSELWPRSVWPGALMVDGELVGTWRRRLGHVVVQPWRTIGAETKSSVETEVLAMPVESTTKEIRWASP